MTEYTSIRVPETAKEIAAESKADGETWAEFMQRCADEGPRKVEVVPRDDIDQRLASIERTLEELQRKRH
jgi:hypothetical protein